MATPAVELRDGQRLVSLQREKDSRSHGYVVSDKFGSVCLVTQILPRAAAYIERNIAREDPVAVASLYEAATKGRLAHRRWRCTRTTLEGAPQAFEEQRRPGVTSVVLSHPHRIRLATS